jgi:hypothetical protein
MRYVKIGIFIMVALGGAGLFGHVAAEPCRELYRNVEDFINGDGEVQGDLDLQGNEITDSTGKITLGAAAASTHALGVNDTHVTGAFEVDSESYFDGEINSLSIQLGANSHIYSDLSDGISIKLENSNQSPKTGIIHTGNTANSVIIAEYGDRTFNFAHPQQTNPTQFWHSANQSTSEWGAVSHDQSKFVISTGDANGAVAIQNVKGAYSVVGADAPVTVTFSGGGDATQTATNFRVAQRKILGISGRVVTTGTTCAGMDIGDGADDDRYGSDIAITDGTVFDIDDAVADPEEFLTTAGDVVITGTNGAGAAANCVDLVVNLTLHWRGYQAATVD